MNPEYKLRVKTTLLNLKPPVLIEVAKLLAQRHSKLPELALVKQRDDLAVKLLLPLPLLLRGELEVGVQHSGAPVEMSGMQLQREPGLGVVVSGQVKVMQLVNIADVELLSGDVI